LCWAALLGGRGAWDESCSRDVCLGVRVSFQTASDRRPALSPGLCAVVPGWEPRMGFDRVG
jgi:hypothetical protein